LKKAAINPATDNVVELLDAAAFCRNPEVVEYLLDFNPDVNAPTKDGEMVMYSYFRSLGWDLGPMFMRRDSGPNNPEHRAFGEARCSMATDGTIPLQPISQRIRHESAPRPLLIC
jgi:hypothetical protein